MSTNPVPTLLSNDPGEAVVEFEGILVTAVSGTAFSIEVNSRTVAWGGYNAVVSALVQLGLRERDAEATVLLAQAAVQDEV